MNCAVLTENRAVALVRPFVDVGLDTDHSFIDPVSTGKSSMVKDRQTGTTAVFPVMSN